MRTVTDLLWLAGASAFPGLAAKQRSQGFSPNSDNAAFADIGERIGEDNEALRNLLIDTSHQLGAVDDLKATFSKLVHPLNNLLNTLEHEKADMASSRGALTAIRSSHEALRAEHQTLEKKSSGLKGDNERLSRDLEATQQSARQLVDDKAKLSSEIAAERVAMTVLVKKLGEEANKVRVLTEEKNILAERADSSDKRISGLEAKVSHSRERVLLLENDKDGLQAALDKTLVESSRTSRHLAERDGALADARSRLKQTESGLGAAESERNKLAAALDEANERRQSDVYALGLKLDALQSRADATETLLADARQGLQARTEEVRIAETKLLSAVAVRSEAEKTAEHLSAASEGWEQKIEKLEQENAAFSERCKVLSETLAAKESSQVHVSEKIKALADQVEQLQAEAATNRAKFEEDVVQFNATIEHERAERALAEGSLETARSDYARIQRQMAEERAMRRRDHQRSVMSNIATPG